MNLKELTAEWASPEDGAADGMLENEDAIGGAAEDDGGGCGARLPAFGLAPAPLRPNQNLYSSPKLYFRPE